MMQREALSGLLRPRPLMGGRRQVVCRAELTSMAKFNNAAYLDKAAQRWIVGIENGLEENELVALELGASDIAELTEVQREYASKIKDKLRQRAEELKAEEKARRLREARNFELGKVAYGRGEYGAAVKLLEQAVQELGRTSGVAGEAQMWLALAYQAVGREEECIELYKSIEANHPIKKVRQQAASLRYILEAPRMEIGPDERVTIPLLETDGTPRRRAERKSFASRGGKVQRKQVEKTYWDQDWSMPNYIPDKWYVRVAWLVLIVGASLYANLQVASGKG